MVALLILLLRMANQQFQLVHLFWIIYLQDKTKCACWQLTMSGVSFKTPTGKGNLPVVGYENRHLSSLVDSGIYECNHKLVTFYIVLSLRKVYFNGFL